MGLNRERKKIQKYQQKEVQGSRENMLIGEFKIVQFTECFQNENTKVLRRVAHVATWKL